jgi:outer membrane immunogenic protein
MGLITISVLNITLRKVDMSRQIKLYILLALLGLVTTSPAYAGEWIFGAKTGPMIVNNSNVKTDPTNVGVLFGYQQGVVLGDIALEGELTTTTSKGEDKGGNKFSADTQAAYVAFRSAGFMYVTAKAGYMQADINSKTKGGSSYGVGFGIGFGVAQVELEMAKAAITPDDVTFINLGVVF